jgi:glucoamylase
VFPETGVTVILFQSVTAILEQFSAGDASLKAPIQSFVDSQAKLQTVGNLSGSLSDGSGLGEPRFMLI